MALGIQSARLTSTDVTGWQAARPYDMLARVYDALLGNWFFPQIQRIFEQLIRRYRICLTSASDVACGTGTLVRYLCARGVPVVYGVDRSPEMLRLAVAKNRGNGARFFLQDMAALRLPRRVSLLTCCFDSLNYLLTTDELFRALSGFHANLSPAGHLFFDMLTDRPPWRGPSLRVEQAAGPGVTFVRAARWDWRRCLQTSFVSISREGRSQREVHVQRGYPVGVVADLVRQAGFVMLGIHDFRTLGPPTSHTRRAVYAAKKEEVQLGLRSHR